MREKNHKNYENYVDFTLPITIRFFPHWSVFNTRAVCIEQILVRWIRPSMLNFHFSLLLQRLFVFIFLRLHLKLCFVMTRWLHRHPNFNNFYRKREKTKQNEIYAATLTHEKKCGKFICFSSVLVRVIPIISWWILCHSRHQVFLYSFFHLTCNLFKCELHLIRSRKKIRLISNFVRF